MQKWQRMQDMVYDSKIVPASDRTLILSRWLAANAIVLIFQFAGLTITTLTQQPHPLWFASGAATAFIFMRGSSILPGVWLGTYFAYYHAGADQVTALTAAGLWLIQTLLIFQICMKWISPSLVFRQLRLFCKFAVSVALVTAAISGLLLSACFPVLPASAGDLWLKWWLADLSGVMVFALAIYSWDYYFPQISELTLSDKIQIILAYTGLTGLMAALILTATPALVIILTLSLVAVTVLLSFKHGWCGAIASSFIVAMMLTFASLADMFV